MELNVFHRESPPFSYFRRKLGECLPFTVYKFELQLFSLPTDIS
jgi:hypothetical protein